MGSHIKRNIFSKIEPSHPNFKVGSRFKGKQNSTIEIVEIPENSNIVKVKYVNSFGDLSKKTYDYHRNGALYGITNRFVGNKITESKLYKVLNDV